MAANLEAPQVALLVDLVEAEQKILPDRDRFYAFGPQGNNPLWLINHRGLAEGYAAHPNDIEVLELASLIRITWRRISDCEFFVHPSGREHYKTLKQAQGVPIERVEAALRGWLNGARFQSRHPAAYRKWVLAEERLLEADTADHLTMIGHHCREAMQEFVSGLVALHRPPGVDQNPANTVAHLRAVLRERPLGSESAQDFLEALIGYWGTVSDLIQRQVHGAQREGERLGIEDGRRVVYQTLNVMYEVDRALEQSTG